MKTTLNPGYSQTKIDKLFFKLFHYYPTKAGKSYEMLVGAVLKIIYDVRVILNETKIGTYDKNRYQIDASLYELNLSKMVEAKDFTGSKRHPVQREDIDKIAGALLELDFAEGYYFSATDYTADAVKKALATHINPRMVKLSLYHLLPSVNEDRKGRVESITIDIVAYTINPDGTHFNPHIPQSVFDYCGKNNLPMSNLRSLSEFIMLNDLITCTGDIRDAENNTIGDFQFSKSLDNDIRHRARENNDQIEGIWQLDEGHLMLHGMGIKLDEIRYKLRFHEVIESVLIEAVGIPVLKIISEDGKINKLITDNQLQGITFSDDGEILFDGRKP